MLPATYQLPAAIVLLTCGIVSCFFGYRLFRTVLAVFGFILGALAASSVWGVSDTWPMLAAAVVGGPDRRRRDVRRLLRRRGAGRRGAWARWWPAWCSR